MTDLVFNIDESAVIFGIAEQPVNFSITDASLTFTQPIQDIQFTLADTAIEFHLGAGVTIISNVLPYAIQADIVSDELIYKGEAFPGALTNSPVWRISKIVILPNEDVVITWAGGESFFAHSWDDRLTLTYS